MNKRIVPTLDIKRNRLIKTYFWNASECHVHETIIQKDHFTSIFVVAAVVSLSVIFINSPVDLALHNFNI